MCISDYKIKMRLICFLKTVKIRIQKTVKIWCYLLLLKYIVLGKKTEVLYYICFTYIALGFVVGNMPSWIYILLAFVILLLDLSYMAVTNHFFKDIKIYCSINPIYIYFGYVPYLLDCIITVYISFSSSHEDTGWHNLPYF